MFYAAYVVGGKLSGGSGIVRWCAAAVTGIWFSSAVFHGLIALGRFNLQAALLVTAAAVAAVRLLGNPFGRVLSELQADFRRASRVLTRLRKGRCRWLLYVYAFSLAVTFLRTLAIPPLGWDTQTYHGVKAGMWVQDGGMFSMPAPGGWGVYQSLFGGYELQLAWAMLPFHGDLPAGLVDALQWLFLGLAVYALGGEIGLRARFRWASVFYILFVPALWLSIGSGYVEPGLNLAIAAGLVFALRFLRRRKGSLLLLVFMALGTAGGIKITGLPILAVEWGLLLLIILVRGPSRLRSAGWLCLGALASAVVLSPWLLWNLKFTNLPLGFVPLKVAGITFGEANKAMELYSLRPELQHVDFVSELKALSRVFRLPARAGPHLSLLTIAPLALSAIALTAFFRRRPFKALLLAGAAAAVLASVYQDAFTVVRLYWPLAAARFLLPLVCIAVPLSLYRARPGSRTSKVYEAFLQLAILFHLGRSAFYGWAFFEKAAVPLGLLLLIILTYFLHRLYRSSGRRKLVLGLMLLLPLVSLPCLKAFRGRTRGLAVAESTVRDRVDKYWIEAAGLVDTPAVARRIAVTSGPYRNLDNWFMYLMLGRDLQNRLFYIPVAKNGNVIDFSPDIDLGRLGDFEAWQSRIRAGRITEIMTFRPASAELRWMAGHPESFTRLCGDGVTWGLYEVH
jgi:4-amino-4-deoxy-L-arabinose transferase-like glycosyltransferase